MSFLVVVSRHLSGCVAFCAAVMDACPFVARTVPGVRNQAPNAISSKAPDK